MTNTNDSGPGSLRSAIDGANPSDTIDIPPGTYRLTSAQLEVDSGTTLVLAGTAGSGATRIESAGAFRVLCISTAVNVEISGLTISGGRGAASGGCADGQGGGIHDAGSGALTVAQSVIEGNSANVTQGGGGGIFKAAGDLLVNDTTIHGNSSTASNGLGSDGGGGIRWTGTGFPSFELRRSTISANTATVSGPGSGGGGIYSQEAPTLENVTLSQNRLAVSGGGAGGGGGALFAHTGGGDVDHATFAGNSSGLPGGAIARGTGSAVALANSILDKNTAPLGASCAGGAVDPQGGNVESSDSCGLVGPADLPATDPELGPLAGNGSANGTQTHELLRRASPAVEFAVSCLETDQRGVGRFGDECDSGAYEYDGRARAEIPDCSPSGAIPVNLDDPPGGDVLGLKYTLDGGPEQRLDTPPTNGPLVTTLDLPEGRRVLQYWGQWTNGVEAGRNLGTVLVDKTDPTVAVENPNPFDVFVIKRRVEVEVDASDSLSGLTTDPSGAQRIATARRGTQQFAPAAVDLCENRAAATFEYRVLAPALGVRAVLERVKGRVRIRRPGRRAGAGASQKGTPFTAFRVPREVPVRTLVDTRRGTVRLTSSRNRRAGIQDAELSGGVFQVLQSRRRRARGLTEVRLKGAGFRSCRLAGTGRPASAAQRRVVRRLRGEGRGRFRTRGRHSAATVRGTTWVVEDRCDGTLTRVIRGRVAVRDFGRRKTIVLRAGQRYLARAPR